MSQILYIAHKLKILHLDEMINKHGYQSVTECREEMIGFYKFYERERYQSLIEKKLGKPLFHGQHLKHMKIEIKPQYAMCLFNNQFSPALIHRGSLGVEQTNSFIEQQEFHRGRKGLKLAYIQMTKVKIAHNLRKIKYWFHEEKISKTGWSDKITKELDIIQNSLYDLDYAVDEIRKNGFYLIKDSDERIMQHIKSLVLTHKLEFTSKPIWKKDYHVILFHWLMEQPKSWSLNDVALKQISNLFKDMFDKEFLIRRCEEWGFYYNS